MALLSGFEMDASISSNVLIANTTGCFPVYSDLRLPRPPFIIWNTLLHSNMEEKGGHLIHPLSNIKGFVKY